ncbi:hypothetical protein B0I21_101158 [Sphingobacterium paludis]|uniref:Uncharacterized protein n=1 Tax=Sphingobacterium paludis TaxID=1476465 RepID=A0A4R7DBM1_9SPHI|nr:hypothetical protein B0I21_101158 [Sphingobacterium paludis]
MQNNFDQQIVKMETIYGKQVVETILYISR